MTLVHGTPERLVTLERNFDNDSAIGRRRSLAPDRVPLKTAGPSLLSAD
jgi:hypothetical protein